MKLLVLCLLFGAAAAALATTDEPENELNNEASQESGLKNGEVLHVEDPDMQDIADPESVDETHLSEAEHGDSAERAKRSCCRPGTWCLYGRRSYVYITKDKHWAHAQRHCQALGGTLAVAHNSGTSNFLKTLSSGNAVWIGLSDAQYDNNWLWINGERNVYRNWCHGEPNNYKEEESCVLINYTSSKCWNDFNCKSSVGFICERK